MNLTKLLILGVGGYVAYKMLTKPTKPKPATAQTSPETESVFNQMVSNEAKACFEAGGTSFTAYPPDTQYYEVLYTEEILGTKFWCAKKKPQAPPTVTPMPKTLEDAWDKCQELCQEAGYGHCGMWLSREAVPPEAKILKKYIIDGQVWYCGGY